MSGNFEPDIVDDSIDLATTGALWVQLHDGAPGEDGTENVATEASGRVASTFPASVDQETEAVVIFEAVDAGGPFTWVTLWDDDTAGNLVGRAPIPPKTLLAEGDLLVRIRARGRGATALPPYAYGGSIVEIEGYRYHAFTTVGNHVLKVVRPGLAEVLIVAGGGGGGFTSGANANSGGGGAGGFIYRSAQLATESIPIFVGDGGQGGGVGDNGENSSLGRFVAVGGGGGAGTTAAPGNGGSGGGNGMNAGSSDQSYGTPGIGTVNQGFPGGQSTGGGPATGRGGGGGGAGGTGQSGIDADASTGGHGGDGVEVLSFSDWGDDGWFAGGGGGSAATGGAGGQGGGGAGGSSPGAGQDGADNTGGGGGGARGIGPAGAGGSGIVLVRYPIVDPEPGNDFTMPYAWWDFADTETIAGSSGNISSILDKSGNGFTLTASGTVQTGVATLNGLNVGSFGGSGYALHVGSTGLNVENVTVIAVVQQTSNTEFSGIVGAYTSGSNPAEAPANGFVMMRADSTHSLAVQRDSLVDTGIPGGMTPLGVYVGTLAGAKLEVRSPFPADVAAITRSMGPGPYSIATGGWFMGCNWDGSSASINWQGIIAEVRVYDRTLSAQEYMAVAIELAEKWGLAP